MGSDESVQCVTQRHVTTTGNTCFVPDMRTSTIRITYTYHALPLPLIIFSHVKVINRYGIKKKRLKTKFKYLIEDYLDHKNNLGL